MSWSVTVGSSEYLIKFRNNLIRFCIWSILLFFCFRYLWTHQAERESLLSGLQVMYERWHVLTYKILQKDYNSLEEKYLLIRRFNEILYTSSFSQACNDSSYLQSFRQKLAEISWMPIDATFRARIPIYFSYLFEAQDYVAHQCQLDL